MGYRKVIVYACLAGLAVVLGAPPAQAEIAFDASGSTPSKIVYEFGNGGVVKGISNFTAPGSSESVSGLSGVTLNNPVSVGSGNTTYGNGGVDHFTISDPSGDGFHYADVAFAYGSGVAQTAGDPDQFDEASRIVIPFDLSWTLEELAAPVFAYQFLNIQLATAKAGDTAGVDGAFHYELDLDSNGSVDNAATLLLSESVTNTTGLEENTVVPLFAFDVLRSNPLPSGDHTLRLHGVLEFSAMADGGAASAILADLSLDTLAALTPGSFAAFQDPLAGESGLLSDQQMEQLMMIQGGGVAYGIVVPEPMTGSILGLGLLGLAATRRRRRVA